MHVMSVEDITPPAAAVLDPGQTGLQVPALLVVFHAAHGAGSHGYHPQTSAAARRTGAIEKDITPMRAISALIHPAYMLDSSQPPLEVRKARASHPQAI
jgi:hypothetical protein